MPTPIAYARPESLSEALEFLERTDLHAAVLGGGTSLVPALSKTYAGVVDLQAVGLQEIEKGDGQVTLGAMVRLQTLVETADLPELLRAMALYEGPNTFRNAGTVGGTVVNADPESELLAAMLVLDAQVTVATRRGEKVESLDTFLQDVSGSLNGGLVTHITVTTGGRTAHERVARTPKDKPIVAVLARRDDQNQLHLAACGVATRPVLIHPDQLQVLAPPGDFRGSTTYRKQMAHVLTQRVIRKLEED